MVDKPAGGTMEGSIRLGKRANRNADFTGPFIPVQIDMAFLSIELPFEFVINVRYGYRLG
jgi:hypothetical protein